MTPNNQSKNILSPSASASARLNLIFPDSYKHFIKSHAGTIVPYGQEPRGGLWLSPEELILGTKWEFLKTASEDDFEEEDLPFLLVIQHSHSCEYFLVLDYRLKGSEEEPGVLCLKKTTVGVEEVETFENFSEFLSLCQKDTHLKKAYLDIESES